MKLSKVLVVSVIFLAGCGISPDKNFLDEKKSIESQTIFITKWDNSFSIEEAECPEEWSPFLLTTKSKKNGSTTYIVRCVQRA